MKTLFLLSLPLSSNMMMILTTFPSLLTPSAYLAHTSTTFPSLTPKWSKSFQEALLPSPSPISGTHPHCRETPLPDHRRTSSLLTPEDIPPYKSHHNTADHTVTRDNYIRTYSNSR